MATVRAFRRDSQSHEAFHSLQPRSLEEPFVCHLYRHLHHLFSILRVPHKSALDHLEIGQVLQRTGGHVSHVRPTKRNAHIAIIVQMYFHFHCKACNRLPLEGSKLGGEMLDVRSLEEEDVVAEWQEMGLVVGLTACG